MLKLPVDIYLQPVAVIATSEWRTAPPSEGQFAEASGAFRRLDSGVPGPAFENLPSAQIVRSAFSSIPIVWQLEFAQEYRGLGEALGQMVDVGEGSDWQIELPVYGAACFVAAGLMANLYPAPRVFGHGPKSVVFNWSQGADNLYLTVSADRVSALVSTPERIQKRVEFSEKDLLNPGFFLSAVQSARLAQPVQLQLKSSVPDPMVPVD